MTPAAQQAEQKRQKWRLDKMALIPVTLGLVGLLVACYPAVASWFSQVNQSLLVDDYATLIDHAEPDKTEQIRLAHQYNKALQAGAVFYSGDNKATGEGTSDSGSELNYRDMLHTPDSLVMARLRVPSAGVDLLIYHGTSDAVLNVGVGHLEGTSLPVGGENTRSVLTAHRGLAEAKLFSDLDRVKDGDKIFVEVFGETLLYRVNEIVVIDPAETEKILPVTGKDLVTLVTCTPLGINSHRILVTGERVTPTPEGVTNGVRSELPEFPWWVVVLGGGVVSAGVYLWWTGRAPSKKVKQRAGRGGYPNSSSPMNLFRQLAQG